jgi:ATP-dependent RNA helicase SUPV3L1/SUV3
MPERAAIVGFSVENVYAIAEFIRRTRGGAAVVMGALSPRTRNAQVALYQNGDVDFLVATDAIGMGLNLDIDHVAFSSTVKFDGQRMRELQPDELAQIAGRAGRGMREGTFGVTGEAAPLDEEVVGAIEGHQFSPVRRLQWRNSRLQFGSVRRLLQTLEERTDNPWLGRVRESDDLAALRALSGDAEVMARATDGPSVKLLWDVCRIPDFRGISRGEHAAMLAVIFNYLHQSGRVPSEFLGEQVRRLDRTEGDIDTLSKRLAFIRTWTYVAQRHAWVGDEAHWRGETRAVEDRLSDALHQALTERFVDRRTSVLARRLRQREALVAEVDDKGVVTVEGETLGRLEGFRFKQDRSANPEEARTLRQAAAQALAPQFHLRADRFYNAPDTEIDYTEQGGLMWGEHAVGRLAPGPEPLRPEVVPFVDEEAGPEVAAKVQRRLQHFMDRRIAAAMEPLLSLRKDESLEGLAKGFAYRLVENLGIIPRGDVAEEVRALDPPARSALRKHGVRIGQFTVFLPALLKPAPTRLRLVLWSLAKGLGEFPSAPPPGHVTVPAPTGLPPGFWAMAGYRAAGDRAIRIDMLERLADMLRERDGRAGFEAAPEMLSITGLGVEAFAHLMEGLGYRATPGERPKMRHVKPARAAPPGPAAGEAAAGPQASADAPGPEPTPTEAPPEAPVEEPPAPPSEPGPAPVEDPPAIPETPPGQPEEVPPEPSPDEAPAEPPATPEEVPVEEPAEAPSLPPVELPPSTPVEAPSPVPMEMPDIAPVEMPISTPLEVPGSPSMAAVLEPTGETEVFYTFTWAGHARRGREGDSARGPRRDRGQGRPAAPPVGVEAQAGAEAAPSGDGARSEARAETRGATHPEGRRGDGTGNGRRSSRPPRSGEERGGEGARGDRPGRGEGRGDRGSRPAAGGPRNASGGGPGGASRNEPRRPQAFEASPPAREGRGRIDPDNPFAAALAGFKAK